MVDLKALRRAQIYAAEQQVIDSLPKELLANLEEAQAQLIARGGCPGCGSLVLAMHRADCPEIKDDIL